MPNIHVISQERHGDKYWKPTGDYNFSSEEVLCPLVAHELPEICLSLPIAFTKTDGKYLPVAVLGLKQGQNLVLGPVGNWKAPYVPRIYRSHPFSLAPSDDQLFLCIDEDFVLNEGTETSQPFYKDENSEQPTDSILQIMEFLKRNLDNAQQTEIISQLLNDIELIEPWPLQVVIDEETVTIQGLYRIDETALNSLSGEDLLELKNKRALVVIYCQLLSMTHMKSLVQLAQGTKQHVVEELNFDSLDEGGTLNFENL